MFKNEEYKLEKKCLLNEGAGVDICLLREGEISIIM